ncbi:hypothetical protein C8J57DRAFT_1735096 [Mycena rebaudengoi]|nr:hypothetical protein C8J57DRAFT_1735096 [Mycena rebaudengoi]
MELEMRRKLGDVTNTASGKKRKKTKTRHASKKRRRAEKDTSETGSNDSSQDEDSQDSDDANGSSSGVEEAADKGALTRVGRLYVLQYGLWVKGGVHIFEQVPDPKYDEKKRFETDTTKIQGQLRDIQKIIPAAYFGKEGRMGGKELVARAFMSGVHSQRSNTSTRIRKAAGPAIFDCGPADLLLPETRLNKFRDQIGWCVEDGTSGGYSSLDVAVLHKNWVGEYDIKTCFLNPALMRLYVALIRGPTAATAMLEAGKRDANAVVMNIPKSDNMEHIHGLTHTEPGAIAGSAVLAIWALSADTCLRDRGDRTNIDYDALFDEYLEILIVGLRDKSTSILNVFAEWDRVIFPTSQSGYGKRTSTGRSAGHKKAMEALMAERQAAEDADAGAEGDDAGGDDDAGSAPLEDGDRT